MTRASAVLFDMDGVLVDSEPIWTIAEEELAERLGGTWSTEIKARVVGTRLDAAVPTILRWYGRDPTPAAVADASRWLLARMVELFRVDLPVYEGTFPLLDALGERGVPLALVSSSFRVLVDAALERLGHHRFATSVAGDEVRHGKPHPEAYLTAAERLGVDPARCVVVEDAWSGVQAGEAAGCVVLAVPVVASLPATPRRPVRAGLTEVDADWLLDLPQALGGAAG